MTVTCLFQAGAFVEAIKPDGPHLWRPARVVEERPDHYCVSFTGDRSLYEVSHENVRERTVTSNAQKPRVLSQPVPEVVDLTVDDSDLELSNHLAASYATPIARPTQSQYHASHDPYLNEQYLPPNNPRHISHGLFYDPHMPPLSPTRPLLDDRFDKRSFEDNRLPFWLSPQRMNHQQQYYKRSVDYAYWLSLGQPSGYSGIYNHRYSGELGYGSGYDDRNETHQYENVPSSGAEDCYRYTSQEYEDDEFETEKSDEIIPPLELAAREKIAREQEKLGVDAVLARVSIPRVPRKRLGSTYAKANTRNQDGLDTSNDRYPQSWRNSPRNRHGHMTLGANHKVRPKRSTQDSLSGSKAASGSSAAIESDCTIATSDDESEIIRRSSRATMRQRSLQRKRRSEPRLVDKLPRKRQLTEKIVASGVSRRAVPSMRLRSSRNKKARNVSTSLKKQHNNNAVALLNSKFQTETRDDGARGNGRRKGKPKKHAGREAMKMLFEVERATRRERREYREAFVLRHSKAITLSTPGETIQRATESNLNVLSCVCEERVAVAHKGLVLKCDLCTSNVHLWCSGIQYHDLESLSSAGEASSLKLICIFCMELIAKGVKRTGLGPSSTSKWIVPPLVNPLLLVQEYNTGCVRADAKNRT